MYHKVYLPSADLQPFIYSYIIIKIDIGNSVETSYIIPHGCPQLIFFCSNPSKYMLDIHDEGMHFRCQSFVGGQINRPIFFEYSGYSKAVAVMFKPSGIYHLLNIPQHEFTNQICDLNLLLGRKRNFIDHIISAPSDTMKIQKTEALLRTYLKNNYQKTKIDMAVDMIIKNKGNINMKKIKSELYFAHRTFERRFQKIIGLTPKEYAKIVRFNHIFKLIRSNPDFDWQDITLLCGYYDQSHLIRDFKRFTDIHPTSYMNKKHEISKVLLGYTTG